MSAVVDGSDVDVCIPAVSRAGLSDCAAFADASTLVRSCFNHSVGAVKQLVARRRTDLDAAVSRYPVSLSLSLSLSRTVIVVVVVLQPSLVQACFNGDPDEVRAILYKKEDVNYQVVSDAPASCLEMKTGVSSVLDVRRVQVALHRRMYSIHIDPFYRATLC